MLTVLFALLGLGAIVALAKWRLPAVLATALILFSLTYRLIDVAYLDMFGPTYATELEKFVGGSAALPYFLVSLMTLIVPLALLFRGKAMRAVFDLPLADKGYLRATSSVLFWLTASLVTLLYLDMLRIGVIPLLSGMDRIQYYAIAGVLHKPVYDLGFIPAGALGILTVLPKLQGRSFGLRAIVVFFLLLLYWALTGNRFSAFLLAVCYYAVPFGALVCAQQNGFIARATERDAWKALVSTRVVLPLLCILGSLALAGLLINSYYDVRGYADPLFEIFQRILVQPVEIFVSQWELATTGAAHGLDSRVIDEVLLHPLDPNSNTTMSYLMTDELGYFRAAELLQGGQQYAGGYPEIFLAMFGIYLSVPFLLLLGSATAFVARLVVLNILRGYLVSAMAGIYVLFGFSLSYVGGMLNSLLAWTFWIKIVALIAAMLFESAIFRRQRTQRTQSVQPNVLGSLAQGDVRWAS